MTQRTREAGSCVWLLVAAALLCCVTFMPVAKAQGTKQWTTDRYDALQRGTTDGVSIRNDGRLEVGMSVAGVYTSAESLIWSVAEGSKDEVYAGVGGDRGASASVIKLGSGGEAKKIFAGKELAVQAIKVAPDGTLFVATSPDGRVYRMNRDGSGQQTIFDPATTVERSKYIWDLAVAQDGSLYVATGAPAAVYRIPAAATTKPELLFRTADAHIRCLLLTRQGVLWAGSDGAGVIYRLDTSMPGTAPFAAYASAHREVTSLVMDEAGAVYAAAVGSKEPTSLPPLPVTGAVGISVTLLQPGSAAAAGANGIVPEGSEIDRIDPDGTPQRLSLLKEDVVYTLLMDNKQLLAATGNRGRIYRIDARVPGRVTEVARVDAGQVTAMTTGPSGVVVASSNGGKLLRLLEAPPKATYTSEVFDAGQYARWGQVESEGSSKKYELFARTGNVPNTMQGWSDWMRVFPASSRSELAAGRYAQWRADLQADAVIDAVTLNYLPRNVAPVVDDIVVANGARIAPVQAVQQPTVQIIFPSSSSAVPQALSLVQQDSATAPLTAQKDRSGIVIRWAAHDDNGDDLIFAVWYRGLGETTWRLLKGKILERYFSFDASVLPDGQYEAKVVASDAPIHTEGDRLSGERVSGIFTVDTIPPVPGVLSARMENGLVHWSFEARDATSSIEHAEISIDAGAWRYVEPVGGLSDSKEERYDTRSALPTGNEITPDATIKPAEHVLAVRVYDRAENMASAKTVVR